jgi:subtilisin family serine protease
MSSLPLYWLPPLGKEITEFWARFQGDAPFGGRSLVQALPLQAETSEPLSAATQVLQGLNAELLEKSFSDSLPSQAQLPDLFTQGIARALQALAAGGIGSSTSTSSGLMSVGEGSAPSRRPDSNAPASNQLLVQWSPATTPEQRDAALALMGGTRVETIRTAAMQMFGQGVIEVIELPPGMSLEQGMRLYANRPGVVVAEPNYVLGVDSVSNDTAYTGGSLWGMYSSDSPTVVGPSGTTNLYGVQAEQAWAQGYTGTTNTVMGVIDTGIDYTHPDLYLNIWLNQGEIRNLSFFVNLKDINGDGMITFRDLNTTDNRDYVTDLNANGRIDAGDLLSDSRWENGVDDDNNGYVDDLIGWDFVNNDNDPYDDNGHGTHCAGTIGGIGGNSTGVAGVTWNTLLMPLKFLSSSGSGSTAGAIKAVDYYTFATNQWDSSYNTGSSTSYVGTSNSWGGGGYSSTLYNSIVNGAKVGSLFVAAAGNSSSNNDSTANYPSNYSTLSAVGWEAVVAVASITNTGALSSFSSYGATTVDLGAPGSSIYSTVPGGYATYSGTSMATPHVAGALVLLAATYPTATPQQLLEALYAGTASTTSLQGKTATGGRLDVNASLQHLGDTLGGGGSPPPPPPPTDPSRTIWGTTGSDTFTGTNGGGSGADQITGVTETGTTPANLGRGQTDTVTGGAGADRFLLADSRGTFYTDGNNKSSGTGDYLWIQDFSSSEDKLQLRSGSQYLYRNASISGTSYTEIYLGNGDNRFSAADELIARLQGTSLAPGSGVYVLGTQTWTSSI